ncbi:MAG: polyphosphate kinase 1, partial [Actinobacteria bacterium]|nr:polyphosphate kinase 1 [Actinomycetota bacterium]
MAQTTYTQAVPVAETSDLADKPQRFSNRELSWLDFNERVLDIAADPHVPLLERVRFVAIFSSNLDEFFMVRVAGLFGRALSSAALVTADGMTAAQTLTEIRKLTLKSRQRQSEIWTDHLKPLLRENGIIVGGVSDCTEAELSELESKFLKELYPVLTPLAVGPGQPFPYISGLSNSLGLFVKDPASGEERFARVKVPEGFNRFVEVGSRNLLIPLEEVIGHFLEYLFHGVQITERIIFRVTRDADLEVSDDADDLLEAVEAGLSKRRFRDVLRLEVSGNASTNMLRRLCEELGVEAHQVYPVEDLMDKADLSQLADLDIPELKFEPWVPQTQPRLSGGLTSDFFAQIRRGDLLVHLPYDSFATTVEAFVRGAAKDPGVIAIKTTVYRTSEKSPLVPALTDAAEFGKQSVCLVELKARFDESHNIEWSKRLEQAGVHVVHGFPDLKIHAKLIMVVRREHDSLRTYVHIGTGNYHSATARLYEDFGLFTADPDIAADVAELFNYLTGFSKPGVFRKILVAPFALRDALRDHITRVAKAASEGEEAAIFLKMNALTDPEIIDELYEASQAGAQIRILVRGICSLRPSIEGLSDNITVRSVLGRFLEHSRVYTFRVGRQTSYFIGSADLMQRNLDQRIEVVVPVEDMAAIGETLPLDQQAGGSAAAPDQRSSSWPQIYPRILELIRAPRSTIVFVNSR